VSDDDIRKDIQDCLSKAFTVFDEEWSKKQWDVIVKVRFLARRCYDEPYGEKWIDFVIDELPEVNKKEGEK
jgi:hypothetical protein